MQDTISRIICEPLNLRAYTVTSLETVKTITGIHDTTPNATVALGRTLSATALLSATLKPKSDQVISVKFSGSGPVHEIYVQADAKGNIRGYVSNPKVDLAEDIGRISFSRTIGAGFLNVVKDLNMKEPYSSVIPLQTGEVASDIAYYLTTSEQIPSAMIIGLNLDQKGAIQSSGGILIQTFPDTDSEVIDKIESNINTMPQSLGDALSEGKDIHNYLADIFDNNTFAITDNIPLNASCRCDSDIISRAIRGISNEELKDMIEKDKGAEITCTFCRTVYRFSEDDLEKLLNEKRNSSMKE